MNERINGSSVYVWLADIDKEWPFHDLLSLCLSEEEIMRAGRFVFEKDKKRFIVSHGVLRRIISGLTGIVPEGIRFSVKEKGKPVVDNAGAGDLRFNISHSGRYKEKSFFYMLDTKGSFHQGYRDGLLHAPEEFFSFARSLYQIGR